MLRKAMGYFFPKRKPRDKLPLLPLRYSSDHSPYGKPPAKYAHMITILKMRALARTDQDAMRLIRRYPGKSLDELIKITTRRRRYLGLLKMFWKRLKRAW